jgi:hypothetical protein
MDRRGEEVTRSIAEQPEVRDKAPNADAAIRGNVEDPPIWQRPPCFCARYSERGEPMGGEKGNEQGSIDETKTLPFLEDRRSPSVNYIRKREMRGPFLDKQ